MVTRLDVNLQDSGGLHALDRMKRKVSTDSQEHCFYLGSTTPFITNNAYTPETGEHLPQHGWKGFVSSLPKSLTRAHTLERGQWSQTCITNEPDSHSFMDNDE
jgi:hypothetical protein